MRILLSLLLLVGCAAPQPANDEAQILAALSAYTADVERATAELSRVREEIGKVIVGQTAVIDSGRLFH